MSERRTLLGWFEYLDLKGRELTLDEFTALMEFNAREYARITMEQVVLLVHAAEHTESMVGALDAAAAILAQVNGLPYAGSAEIRMLLDARRDEQRRLASEARAEDQAT